MPPNSAGLPAEEIALVESWIRNGASFECSNSGPVGDAGTGKYHPEGFNDPAVHGAELKLGLQDCRSCHGSDLTGGVGPSCDSCHNGGDTWRTNCTFCHGGVEDDSGAPPRELSGETALDQLRFRAHGPHVRGTIHAPFDCTTCHTKPSNVLSANHVFDDTPGVSELNFSAGLSSMGTYDGNGSCSNLYCHGNGRGHNGSYDHTRGSPTCGTCHASRETSERWREMSGMHSDHLQKGLQCSECHNATTRDGRSIADVMRHVNGVKDVAFLPNTIVRTNAACSGTCHGEDHDGRDWYDD